MAGSLRVCGREKSHLERGTGLYGGGTELKNPRKRGGESRGGASTPPSTGSTFCGCPSEPVSSLLPHPQACAPLWSRACGSSVFSSGICARVDASFRPQGSLAPTAQREQEEGPEDSVLRTGCRVGKNGAPVHDAWQGACMASLVAT